MNLNAGDYDDKDHNGSADDDKIKITIMAIKIMPTATIMITKIIRPGQWKQVIMMAGRMITIMAMIMMPKATMMITKMIRPDEWKQVIMMAGRMITVMAMIMMPKVTMMITKIIRPD